MYPKYPNREFPSGQFLTPEAKSRGLLLPMIANEKTYDVEPAERNDDDFDEIIARLVYAMSPGS